ncbi:MAG: CDP-alcohol phosphatidyltransferase family protein, partial [Kofleriaceae bacterium]
GAPHTEQIVAWAAAAPSRPLVAIEATDHVVHVPLVQAVMTTGSAIAVDERGAFGGAIWAELGRRGALIAASTSAASLASLAAAWRTEGVPTAAYGELSRHPARTAEERREAVHFLFGLIRKSQDSWLVRTINRKVSYPFTRLLLPITALTPNMISIIVFLIGAFGCLVLTTPTYEAAVVGTGLLLFAGYLDGCDGEVARIRLESSKLGAWIDTMADEATTVLSLICVGIHAYRLHPSTWLAWVVAIAAVMAVISVLSIYYYLLTSGGSGNSQDYPTTNPILNVLRYIIRREAINLGSFVLCVFGQILVLYVILAVGAAVSSSVLVTQQILRTRARRTAEPTQAG